LFQQLLEIYTFFIKKNYLLDEALNWVTQGSDIWVSARGAKREFLPWKLGLRSKNFLKTRNQKFNSA